ncbi:MAG: L-lactate permease [Candidatus Gracilibacteria bacterium]|nr:L-lactate permease [Candidatus Gracilibacteria bacterium]
MQLLFSLLPIALLIVVMARRRSMPAYFALPGAAALMLLVRILFFKDGGTFLAAATISGVLTALTPILIVWGAVFLFRTIEVSGALKTIRHWLNGISPNPVAQVMIVGWSFCFLIEGASGFGTPAALAAPILVGLGFPAVPVVAACLVFDSVPVSFGAVGMPTWFGLGNLGFSPHQMVELARQTASIHFLAGLVIPVLGLRFLVSWKKIRQNWGFILLSILACLVPYWLIAQVSAEFPALLGGALGFLLTIFFARRGWGLRPHLHFPQEHQFSFGQLAKAFFPLWGVILLLVLTRLEFFPLRDWLLDRTPLFSADNFRLSVGGVLSWRQIFGTDISWSHAIGYVPSFIPFWVISLLSWWWFRVRKTERRAVVSSAFRRILKPAVALFGALVLVQLLLRGDPSPAGILGTALASVAGGTWPAFAAALGALGAFFSGSNTVSNLTFGGVQQSVAYAAELNPIRVAALQNVGGAAGNMVCLHNIIAACAVLGLHRAEGRILRKTFWPLLVYLVIAGVIGILF